jgi:hypothetical protein
VRRLDFASLCSPVRSAVLAAALILFGSALGWQEGRQPQLPLEPLSVATSLAAGTGFANPFWQPSGPTAWVTPALPFIYACALVVSKGIGVRAFWLVVGFNLFSVAAATYLVQRFCIARWSTSARLAFLAAFLGYCLLDGNVLTYPGALTAAETALLLSGLAVAWRRPGSLQASVMLFVANALLAVTHPGLAMAGFAASGVLTLLVWRTPAGRSAGLLRSGALAVSAALLVGAGPWAIRNRVVFHQWIAAKSNGYFELVLAHEQTRDGVLTETSILAGNPSTNLRVFREYQRLGEKAFLEGYRERARQILSNDLGRYLLYCRNRLFNALCFSQEPGDTDLVLEPVDNDVGATLVGRGLVLYFGVNPTTYLWPRSEIPASEERSLLVSAGVRNIEPMMADWTRAQGNIRIKDHGPAAILVGLLWSGIPSACLLGAVLLGSGTAPRLVLGAACIYLLALLPNVMITHDMRHQCDFELIFALLVSVPIEVLRRRLSRRDAPVGP